MVPSKFGLICFLAFTCLQVLVHPENITPVEIQNSNQEQTKLLINQLDADLTELVLRFPDADLEDPILYEEFRTFFSSRIEESFKKFYEYMIATKPKTQIHAIILYLQYCELIFKHGATSKHLQLKNDDTKEHLCQLFIMNWVNLFLATLSPLTKSFSSVFINNATLKA